MLRLSNLLFITDMEYVVATGTQDVAEGNLLMGAFTSV
jgi:hypothetical protein